jgi:pilus assembly protein CpaE
MPEAETGRGLDREVEPMLLKLRLLLAGRSRDSVAQVERFLRAQTGVQVKTRLISNGHADPLYGLEELPDTLLYVASDEWRAELASLMARPPSMRPPIIVVGPAGAMEMIRASMRAGARDFLSIPLAREEVTQTLKQIADERAADDKQPLAFVTAILNGKGGSGATILAGNLACAVARESARRTLLVDLNLQFGSLPTYFNLAPSNGFAKALELAEGLDQAALQAFVQRTEYGPTLLSAAAAPLILPEDVADWRLESLVNLLAKTYDDILLDVPRVLDRVTAAFLEHADRLLIVIQQTIAHLRDTKRLLEMLQDELGLSEERLLILVNRYDKKAPVSLSDIRAALNVDTLFPLPNDYGRVTDSVNAGIPLVQMDGSAPLAKRLVELASGLRAPMSELSRPESGWRVFNWLRS